MRRPRHDSRSARRLPVPGRCLRCEHPSRRCAIRRNRSSSSWRPDGYAGYAAASAGRIQIRASAAAEIVDDDDADPHGQWDVGVLLVGRKAGAVGFTAWGVGLAATGGEPGRGRDSGYVTLGVPVELQGVLATPWIGLGLTFFGNLNPEASFGGLVLSLFLGQLPR